MKTQKKCEWQAKRANQNQMFPCHICLPSTKVGWNLIKWKVPNIHFKIMPNLQKHA
jgi:hypothetical protein